MNAFLGARIEKVIKDGILPEDFYTTTNYETQVSLGGKLVNVENLTMDSAIVVSEGRAFARRFNEVREGDLVVVGRKGIQVKEPEETGNTFHFMRNEISSERSIESLVQKVAREIVRIKQKGGKIGIVAGPAVVHSGGRGALADILRMGLADVLLTGNALAVHDMESALYGTSLGVCPKTLRNISHHHHLWTINRIRSLGSIQEAVKQGILKEGIMYECVQNNIPFVLAGSIRDDGPLPETITDVMEAQKEMKKYLDLDMVLMLASTLHSIAVGNMLAHKTISICVDINSSVVTKLQDRGTQSIGIVTDVGSFLILLQQALKNIIRGDSLIDDNG